MLFDVNCFLGTWPFSLVPEMSAGQLVRHLARAGVGQAAVSPLAAVFQPEPMPANEALFAALRGKRALPLPVINPVLANWKEQLEACAAAPGVRAVRLYSNYHNYRLTSAAMRPIVDALTARGLRLVITARLEDERHRYFALKIKGVPVAEIAAFLGSNPGLSPLITGLSVTEALELAALRENFHADIAYQENVALAAMLRGKIAASRLMFGSLTPLVSAAAQAGKLSEPGFTAQERRRIGSGNAARFFSLTPMPIVDEPFPRPTRWGEPELARLTTMLGQTSLFYWKGPQTAALLEEFHKLYPFRFLAPCSSGTASLHIALAALRLRPGDEVIVPPITDMGSVIGVLYQQAVPVFADLDPGTYNLDPAAVRNAITSRTRAIMVVHLAGNPCDMRAILPLAREHRLAVIEDCAQAWGAEHEGRPVGSFGDFGCYSFNDYKHISCGDGGMVGTQSEQYGVSLGKWGTSQHDRVAGERDIALLRDPADLAPNYRITEPQAAIAAAQLPKLGGIVTRRIQIATRLNEALGAIPGIQPPVTRPGDKHSFWFYLFRLELERFRGGQAGFAEALRAEGVNLSAGYLPKPLYGYRVFQNHNFFGGAWPVRDFGLTRMDYRQVRCPVAEAILGDSILLYMNEAFSDGYVAKLIRAVESVARRLTR